MTMITEKNYIDPLIFPNAPREGTYGTIYWDSVNTHDRKADWHSVLTINKPPMVPVS